MIRSVFFFQTYLNLSRIPFLIFPRAKVKWSVVIVFRMNYGLLCSSKKSGTLFDCFMDPLWVADLHFRTIVFGIDHQAFFKCLLPKNPWILGIFNGHWVVQTRRRFQYFLGRDIRYFKGHGEVIWKKDLVLWNLE